MLPGMTHREKALIELMVRFHRKGMPKPGPMRKLLNDGDQKLLERLTCCLRIAEYLERARANRIGDVEVEIQKRRVDLKLIAKQAADVEIYEVEKQSALFDKAFGRRLKVTSSVIGTS